MIVSSMLHAETYVGAAEGGTKEVGVGCRVYRVAEVGVGAKVNAFGVGDNVIEVGVGCLCAFGVERRYEVT